MVPDPLQQASMTNPGTPSPGPGMGQPNAGITIPMLHPAAGRHGKAHHKAGGHRRGRAGKKHGR